MPWEPDPDDPQRPGGGSTGRGSSPFLKARRADTMDATPTTWLAKGWIPRKDITVLVGEEGIGKSLGWVRFAAAITTGHADSLIGFPRRPPKNVLAIVTEDTVAEVVARLTLAGADMKRIHFFCAADDGTGTPIFGANPDADDFLTLQTALVDIGDVALVVVDSWVDTVNGALVLKDGQQARTALKPWKTIARTYNLSVVLLTHTNRLDTSNIRDLMGTTSILRQFARMILVAGTTQDERGKAVWIGPDKANGTSLGAAVKFEIGIHQVRPETEDDPGRVARLQNPVSAAATIQDLFTQWKKSRDQADKPPSKAELVEEAVRKFMEGHAARPVKAVRAHLAKTAGEKVIDSVLRDIGTTRKVGNGWVFMLGYALDDTA
ncbi:AAA family ATPase [Sinomonas albida]|uniref:AAA family ATPase n=1 Tax=Sinomonas albida TaxID=369942 RepID=UPI003019E524